MTAHTLRINLRLSDDPQGFLVVKKLPSNVTFDNRVYDGLCIVTKSVVLAVTWCMFDDCYGSMAMASLILVQVFVWKVLDCSEY